MLPLVDRPLLAYTFEHLARHGVERAIISCGYLPTRSRRRFGDAARRPRARVRGRGRAARHGRRDRLRGRGLDGSFFALNGDSLREADLGELVAFHRSTGAKATILLTPVADPSRYGLVRTAADGRVETFLEKPRPEEIDTDLINAGLYVLEPEVLELVPAGPRRVDRARGVPAARSRGRRVRDRAPGLLARRRHARVVPAGAPRRARADLPDRGRRRARRRLHARRPDAPTSIPARGSSLPCTSGRARSSRTGARLGSLAVLGAGSRLARGRRRRERRRRRADDGRRRLRASSARSSATTRSSAPAASCATLRSSALARRSASGNVARPRAPDRRRPDDPRPGAPLLVSGAAERYDVAAQGREALGLGARLGRDRGLRRASSSSSARASP